MFGIRTVAINRTAIAQAVADFTRNLLLYLKGDSGYNKNQNNTILDRSVNDFAVTRAGDVAQTVSSYSPFSSSWSYFFDGTGDYATITNTAITNFGTGDFTIELWFNRSTSTQPVVLSNAVSGSDNNYFNLNTSPPSIRGTGVEFQIRDNAGQAYVYGPSIPADNTWAHIAVTRRSGSVTVYVNGIGGTPVTITKTITARASVIGAFLYTGAESYFQGYISNLRIVNGTALYTTNFTAPSAPLSAVSGTSLLTCHAGRLFDASSNAADISVFGNTSASNFAPFTKTAVTGTVGSTSVVFNGTSDYLSVPNSTALQLMTSDYTVEAWVYPTALPSSGNGGSIVTNTTTGSNGWELRYTTSARLALVYPGTASYDIAAVGSAPVGAWTHVAIVKSGSTVRGYINGVQYSIVSSSPAETNGAWRIGYSGQGFPGRISNLRIVKGTALYTTGFTPSTTELSAVSGTSLLTCQGNSICDNSSNNATITTVSTARVSGANPFNAGSGWSGNFNGTTDYLTVAGNSAFDFGTGDFTVEGWWFTGALSATVMQPIGYNAVSVASNADVGFFTYLSSTLCRVAICNGANQYNIDGWQASVAVNRWQHFAIVRKTGVVSFYLDGIQVGTVAANVAVNYSATWQLRIGTYTSAATRYFNGQLSNVRIVKGTAVYAANFTPSTTALTAVTGTSILALQSNAFKDNSSNAFSITPTGTPGVRAVGPFGEGSVWSGYFDGSGDYLTVPSNAAFQLGTGDFTIECWINRSTATNGPIIDARGSNAAAPYAFYVDASNFPYFYDGTTYTSTVAITTNQWNHIVVVRTSGVLKIFVNGTQGLSTAHSLALNPAATIYIGGQNFATPAYTTGSISNLRIVKGTAIYTAAFTPPTSALTAVANTSLLTLQNNAFRDNSSNAFSITRVGDTRTVTDGPFAITYPVSTAVFPGSVYFDGANDYLTVPASANLNLFGGDFTIECWFNPTTLNASGYNYLIMQDDGANASQNFQLLASSGGAVTFASWTSSTRSSVFSITSTRTIKLGAWNHIAVSCIKSTNTTRLFVNGNLEASSTSVIWAGSNLVQTCIGNFSAGAGAQSATYSKLNGYLTGVRFTKGTALYTTSFSPPRSLPVSLANSPLCLNFNDGAVIDGYASNTAGVLSTVGNVGTDAGIKKYGTNSLYFDGTGDYITMAGQPEYAFGTGDFTVECWVNPAALGKIIYDSRSGAEGAYVALYLDTDGTVKLSVSSAYRITTRAILANTWTHVALVRSGGVSKIYLDGIQSGSSYTDSTVYLNGASRPIIGASGLTPSTLQWNGYMDDMRVYRGLAKYTTTFLPAESESTVSSPSSFSWAMAGAYPGDALTATSTSALALGTGDFTAEAWVYINANTANTILIVSLYDSVSTKSCQITFGNGGFGYKLGVGIGSTSAEQWSCALTQTSILGTWTHIAFTRQSSTCRLFVNGVIQNIGVGANPSTYPSTSFTNTVNMGNQSLTVGSGLNGYITDARVIKGTALYTANFTPPTAKLTAVSGTAVLTAQNASAVDNSSSALTITAGGNARATAVYSLF